jgi:Family of unknown function (DUF6152)
MKYAVLATLGLLTAAGPAFAHHPFDSEFDARAPMSLTGTVTKYDWVDPHVIVYVDVKDASGQTRNWHMETGSLAEMGKNGWTKATLKEGDRITIQGYRAKSEPYFASARVIELPGGKKMSSVSDDGGPQK